MKMFLKFVRTTNIQTMVVFVLHGQQKDPEVIKSTDRGSVIMLTQL